MLTVTPAAAEALDVYATTQSELPDTACARIAQRVGSDGQPALAIGLVDAPGPDDTAVEAPTRMPLFIEAATAGLLDDKVLDARSQDGATAFVIGEQTPAS
jgi:hypothetical protein